MAHFRGTKAHLERRATKPVGPGPPRMELARPIPLAVESGSRSDAES